MRTKKVLAITFGAACAAALPPGDAMHSTTLRPDPASANAVEVEPPATEPALPGLSPPEGSELQYRARKMAGDVDRALRSESGLASPDLTDASYKRFVAGLEAATAKKWTGVATVTETTMPITGERLYKISNGTGTYCVRIYHPNVGIDRFEWHRKNFAPITCPK